MGALGELFNAHFPRISIWEDPMVLQARKTCIVTATRQSHQGSLGAEQITAERAAAFL